MATLEYRFTQSAPVMRDLARSRAQSSSPLLTNSSEYPEKVKPFEFIDSSLTLLGDLQRIQDQHLRREFEQQREFITSKFEREQYENGRRDGAVDDRFTKIKEQLDNFKEEVGQRFEEVGQRFEEVGQRFDHVDAKLDNFQQAFDQRLSEMNALMFNALAYRKEHPIHPLPILRGGHLQKPEKDCFPSDVRKFWALQLRKNAFKRFHLIRFYSIEYKRWNRDSETVESDSSDSSEENLSLDDAARNYPSEFLGALAARLGLNYNNICAEMKRLQELQQQTAARSLKRPQADIASSKDGETSKRAHRSPASSCTSESQPEQSGSRRSLQVRGSQGATDVVAETVLLGTEQRSQGSTEVFTVETTQPTR